jgi:hypothetical protein
VVKITVNPQGQVASIAVSGTISCPTPPTITIAPPTGSFGERAVVDVRVTAVSATITNGGTGGVTAAIVRPGSGYAFPPQITATGGICPGGLKVKTKIIDGMLKDITFDGACTTLPTFTIPAPQVQATATMVLDTNKKPTSINITNPGAGYVFTPNVTITTTGKCDGTIIPTVTMSNGYIKKIEIPADSTVKCLSGIPTISIDKPSDTATATATKTTPDANNPGIDKFNITITKPGTGYKVAPRVTIT